MADEQLRMQATVVDGFTGPLRALNNLLTQVGANPAAKQVSKEWQGVSTSLNRVTTEIRTGLQPALAGIGIASLGIGGAIGSAAMALKTFAFNTRELNLFSRQIGLSVDQLRQLKAVGERFGMDWNSAQGSLKAFAGNMDQLQRRWGEAYGRLRAMNLGELAEGLVSAPNMQAAIDKALDGLKSIQNPVRRREVAQLLFGSDQWATVAAELTPTLRAEIRKLTAAIGPDTQKAADEFVSNWHRMQQSVDNFVVQGLGPALKPLNDLIDLLNKPVGAALADMMDRLTKAAKYLGEGEWLKGLRVLDGGNGSLARRLAPLPGDDVLNRQDQVDALRRQIENADRQIGITEGRGGDTRAMRGRRDDLAEQLRKLTEELKAMRGGATVQQQSFGMDGGGGMAGLIQRAAFGGYGGGGGGNPFSAGFWGGIYRGGVGGDPFRGGGRTYDGGGSAPGGGGPNSQPGPTGGRRGASIDYGAGGSAPTGGIFGCGDPNNHRAMDPMAPAGSGMIPASERATITLSSGRKIVVHKAFAENFKGFLEDYEKAGGVVGPDSGGVGSRPGNSSYHPSGRAIDLNQVGYGIRSRRGVTLPEEDENRLAAKWGLYPGSLFGRRNDRGHFEVRNAAHARAVLERMRRGEESGPLPEVAQEREHPFAAGAAKAAGWRQDREDAASGSRTGDSMMGRAFGTGGVAAGAPKLNASGSVTINLTGGLEKAPARVTMDGLFKDVQVNRKQKMAASHVEDI